MSFPVSPMTNPLPVYTNPPVIAKDPLRCSAGIAQTHPGLKAMVSAFELVSGYAQSQVRGSGLSNEATAYAATAGGGITLGNALANMAEGCRPAVNPNFLRP